MVCGPTVTPITPCSWPTYFYQRVSKPTLTFGKYFPTSPNLLQLSDTADRVGQVQVGHQLCPSTPKIPPKTCKPSVLVWRLSFVKVSGSTAWTLHLHKLASSARASGLKKNKTLCLSWKMIPAGRPFSQGDCNLYCIHFQYTLYTVVVLGLFPNIEAVIEPDKCANNIKSYITITFPIWKCWQNSTNH